MKIIHLSDTHGYEPDITLEKCDIAIHSGDADLVSLSGLIRFCKWFKKQNARYKIYVAGNHDFYLETMASYSKTIFKEHGIIYLENNLIQIENVIIYGSPYTPRFGNWAFMRERGNDISKIWEQIPENIDILVTHGGPMGILDIAQRTKEHVGCDDLKRFIKNIKPKFHLFGHLHENYGIVKDDNTVYVNSALITDGYVLNHEPHIIELGENKN